jgi:hypothetical protein
MNAHCNTHHTHQNILSKAHEQYLLEHPGLRDLLSDYLQTLLLQKPTDVLAFTRDYFATG